MTDLATASTSAPVTAEASTAAPGLLQGLCYGFPLEGAIRTGRTTTSRGGKKVPVRDDEFRITRQFKQGDTWEPHPLDATLREQYGESVQPDERAGAGMKKLRKIPVVIAFDNPDLTVSTEYSAFSADEKTRGMPVCAGDGCRAKRKDLVTGQITDVECAPRVCAFGAENRCAAMVRTLVFIEGQQTESAGFMLRSGSINAMKTLRHTLESLKAAAGGLAGAPMWLVLEAKSSAQSFGSTFYYGQLYHRHSNVMDMCRTIAKRRADEVEAGFDRKAYEAAILAMRNNGGMGLLLDDSSDEAEQIDDLIEARFVKDGEDGAAHAVRVGGPSSAEKELKNLQARLREGVGATLTVREKAAGKTKGEPSEQAAADGGAAGADGGEPAADAAQLLQGGAQPQEQLPGAAA